MTASTDDIFQADVDAACRCMLAGGVIAYPTDTVWGLGCDARNAEAVARIFAIKRRAESKALITLVDSLDMLARHVSSLPPVAVGITEQGRAEGRPITMVIDGATRLADGVAAADGSAGFRITAEAYSAALCRGIGGPIVSTSANRSGEPAAALFAEIDPEVLAECDYVAMWRRDDSAPARPSKVVKISADGALTVLRP